MRKQAIIFLLGCSALLAGFLLKDVVEQLIILPAVYLLWLLGILYHYIPQPVLWVIFIMFMSFLVLGPLFERIKITDSNEMKRRRTPGPVEELAGQIERKQDGIYFKWQIARLLAQTAMDLQELRQHLRTRKIDYGADHVPERVQVYLDAGMNTSFSDYPAAALSLSSLKERLFRLKIGIQNNKNKPGETVRFPIDHDIEPVITYLESKMENNDDYKRA